MVVKEKYGEKLECLILDKISLLPGDITFHNLGLKDSTLEELFGEVEIVINLAATTDFDGRYDIALGINTIGAANVFNFSKKCSKLRVFLHVSTAYVCGEKEGVIVETPLKVGDTPGLDIEMERKVVEDKLKHLQALNASQKYISSIMKDLGSLRARKYGWPNTYCFTKAMGEMLLGELKAEKVPLLIIRPTIITSTFKQPFPGWIEGVRHVDSFIIGYGKGKMTCFPGNPQTIIDLIPADIVVNVMIASMAAHATDTHMVYHVGSSMWNPVEYGRLQEYGLRFFTEQPWMKRRRDGTPAPIVVRRGTQLCTKKYTKIHATPLLASP
ncbi:hypothetical protein ACS0TY_020660 [Phlomoides rotata]